MTAPLIIRNTEKGVLAVSNKGGTIAKAKEVEMYDVQNGIEIVEKEMGNFLVANVLQCTIECTKYFGRIEKTSTALSFKDLFPLNSWFSAYKNIITIKQDAYYTVAPGIPNYEIGIPTGIVYSNVIVGTQNALAAVVRIHDNDIYMTKGHYGIWVDNPIRASINQNKIIYPDGFQNINLAMSGITNEGGRNSFIYCNEITVDGDDKTDVQGIGVAFNANASVVSNILKNNTIGLTMNRDNGTLCYIHGNQFVKSSTSTNNTAGISYPNTITGPQVLQGNQWIGDFDFGAHSGLFNDICLSKYFVTTASNVNNSLNPVVILNNEDCNGDGVYDPWFEILTENEIFDACLFPPFISDEYFVTDSDHKLADGVGQNLSQGMRWSALTNLYDKLNHTASLQSHPDLYNFFNSHSNDEIGQMANARAFYDNSNYSLYLLDSIRHNNDRADSLAIQLQLVNIAQNNSASKQLIIQQIDSLKAVNEALDLLLNADLDALHLMADIQFQNAACNSVPCQTEKYIVSLFNDAVLLNKRQLDSNELTTLKNLAGLCEEEYGPSILSARAWYFIATGERIASACATPQIPFLQDTIESRMWANEIAKSEISIAPNPANSVVNVKVSDKLQGATLALYNIYGQLVLQRAISETENIISVNQISDGTYLVTVRGSDGQLITSEKLIIQR